MLQITDILDSVIAPELIKDEIIKNGEFEKNPTGGLIFYSGGFTVVFPVQSNGKKWAFRCWYTELGNVRERFKKICDYVNSLDSQYFCDLTYCDEGIIVNGKIYPTTRMSWVEGATINKYIQENINDRTKLEALGKSFISMTEFLHEKKIAHGDLQHENIIIQDGKIHLVDYDSIFVPGLEGYSDIITGKPDFQHPRRKNASVSSEKLDFFSELVIYLSIIALSKQPRLLDKYPINDSLLFRKKDWENFEESKIYKSLHDIGDDDIDILLMILCKYLKEEDINNLEPFTKIWNELVKKPVINKFQCGANDGIVYRNEDTTILWEIANFEFLTIDGKDIPNGTTSLKKRFTSDTEILLTVRNGLHSISLQKKIKVVDKPVISFYADKNLLKKRSNGEIEFTMLRWDVKNSSHVTVTCKNEILSKDKPLCSLKIRPTMDSAYELTAIGLDNISEFKQTCQVLIRETAEFSFGADKLYTLPGVPVTLYWKSKHTKSLLLNGVSVDEYGQSVIYPSKDEEFILSAEDDFGIESKKVTIKMLPLPIIRTILAPTPDIERIVNVQHNAPQFVSTPPMPEIKSEFISIKLPIVPDLKDSGFFIELIENPKMGFFKKIQSKITKLINLVLQ